MKVLSIIAAALIVSWLAGAASAHEEITVADGGSLSGTVILLGEVPKPKGYNLVTFPDPLYCGRISDGRGWRLLQTFHIGAEQAFEDVVVLIEGIEKGKKRRLSRRSIACSSLSPRWCGIGIRSKWSTWIR